MDLDEKILEHLSFAAKRDAEKGGDGLRTTREVADRAEVDIREARRALERLWRRGAVQGIRGGLWASHDPL